MVSRGPYVCSLSSVQDKDRGKDRDKDRDKSRDKDKDKDKDKVSYYVLQ